MINKKPLERTNEYSERNSMVNGKVVTVIPSKKELIAPEEKPQIRVAAYARVSKDSESQEESYEAQKTHAEEVISKNPQWILTKIYADQGSGLNTKKRPQFRQMIKDAKHGQMDMILVKSISRFGRSVIDTLTNLRELEQSGVTCYFERENMKSDDPNCTLLLNMMSSMAESESLSISANVNLGLKYKAERGEWSCAYSNFLGYDQQPDGTIVVNDKQAETVKLIFDRFLSGMTLNDLAKLLESEGRTTGSGSTKWSKASLSRVISNPKYCGDVLIGRTYTADVRQKRRTINNGERQQFYVENGIDPIIGRQTYFLAKGELLRRAAGSKGQDVTGPKVWSYKNCFTYKIRCPKCHEFYNHSYGRGVHYWKCHWRMKGDCDSDIIREDYMKAIVLSAAQVLWDRQPKIRFRSIPDLTKDTSDKVLMEVAGKYAFNVFASRVQKMLEGDRPTVFTDELSTQLVESITFTDSEWIISFYGNQEVRLPKAGTTTGRRLNRS